MSRNTLCLTFCLAFFVSTAVGADPEPNNDFLTVSVLPSGVLFVSDSLDATLSGPDTILGFFADDTFASAAIASDDDSGPVGNGLGSTLTGLPVNADGSIPLAVTGFDDFGFIGTHFESGEYEISVDVFDALSAVITSFVSPEMLDAGTIDTFPLADPSWMGGTFTAHVDNSLQIGPDPLDFWQFTDLPPGQVFDAEIVTGDFDSHLALLDNTGVLVAIDDDSGSGSLSRLTGIVPADGQLYLAVSGYPDVQVAGNHSESGNYTLVVTVPELSGALLLICAGLTTVSLLCRRR